MRIKKGIDPIGTEHVAKMFSGEFGTEAIYQVTEITGDKNHGPNTDDPIVWLELNRKTPHPVDNFINLPLSRFVKRFNPFSEADIFWKREKSDVEIQTEEI